MDANSTGLRGLLDVVKSNRLMSTGVIGESGWRITERL